MSKIELIIKVDSVLVGKLKEKGIDYTQLFIDAANEKLNETAVFYPEKESVIVNPEMVNAVTGYNPYGSYHQSSEDDKKQIREKMEENNAGDIVL